MPKMLQTRLDLRRCPHCGVDTPNLTFAGQQQTVTYEGQQRQWALYACGRCGGVITATAPAWNQEVAQLFPSGAEVSSDVPDRARTYLDQAINSVSAPAGAVMLAASAVDAMLKAKGLVDGSLYARIEQAAKGHLLTQEMAQWAHDVRLDANDQRHSDEEAPFPSIEQAKKCIDFALALAQFMFVLPARVQRGIQSAKSP